MVKSSIMRIIAFFLFFLLSANIAFAGKYSSDDTWRNIINHDLTIEKILKWEYEAKYNNKASLDKLNYYNGQSIFWRGYVSDFKKGEGYYFTFKVGNKEIPVYCSNITRNLDFNRNGCKVGVKGKLVIKNGLLTHLQGKSVVLMVPPYGCRFVDFQKKHKISSRFIINSPGGKIEMEDKFYPYIIFWVLFHNPNYDMSIAETTAKGTIYYSRKYNIDPKLLLALFTIESAMDYDAVSSAGAIGYGQLMPGTAAGLGLDPYDPFQNIGGAASHLKEMINHWSGYSNGLNLAIASYNAGAGAVSYYGGIPPYSETQNYVFFVNFMYRHTKNMAIY